MAERPILFSGPMVRAILEGRKTQTRRVIPRDHCVGAEAFKLDVDDGLWYPAADELCRGMLDKVGDGFRCPYGQPGDELWVREAWQQVRVTRNRARFNYFYRATDPAPATVRGGWRPSIHMPRWASRIQLVIRDVRVQRLQEISEEDAVAEGVTSWQTVHAESRTIVDHQTAREVFQGLWDSINSKRAPWSSNPYVWAITFERKA